MPQKRDASYYSARLQKDHPSVFAALKAGKYKSVRAAAIAVGIVKEPGQVAVLKRNWLKASAPEKKEFLTWLKGRTPARKPASIVDGSGVLTEAVARFLYDWTISHSLKPGRIMAELGYSRNDYRLAEAMKRLRPIAPELVPPLSGWLLKSGYK